MKQANRIILIAIAVLTVPATGLAKGPSVFGQGSRATQPVSTTSHDGTHPMPPPYLA